MPKRKQPDKFEVSFNDLTPEAQERWRKFLEPHTMEGCLEERIREVGPVATIREGCPEDAGMWSHDRNYLKNDLLSAFEKYAKNYDRGYLADDKEVRRVLDVATDNIFRIYSYLD